MQLADAMNEHGVNLIDQGRLEDALRAFVQQARMFKGDYRGFCNAGLVEFKRHHYRDAGYWFAQAWKRGENEIVAHNRGNAFAALGEWSSAEQWFRRATQLKPDYAIAWHALSSVQLSAMNWSEGWANHRFRKGPTPGYRDAPWPPETQDCSLLILRDQGLGDEIFALRWHAACCERMKAVVYEPDLRLMGMLKRAGIEVSDSHPKTDLFCASIDLPFLLGMQTGDPVPPTITLAADKKRIRRWQERLRAAGPPPWIGVTWRSGTRNDAALFKEAPVEDLADALKTTTGTFVAIQRGDVDCQRWPALGEPEVSDVEDMLALMACLDEYICTSNTNLHLRHALGLPSRVLVPNPPDWRWLRAGDESPWFPGSAIYRQKTSGDWKAALYKLAWDLNNARDRNAG